MKFDLRFLKEVRDKTLDETNSGKHIWHDDVNVMYMKLGRTLERYFSKNNPFMGVDWEIVREIYKEDSCATRFICLYSYCYICLDTECAISKEAREYIRMFLETYSDDEVYSCFFSTDKNDVMKCLTCIRRCLYLNCNPTKEHLINLLNCKNINFKLSNDSIRIDNIEIKRTKWEPIDVHIPYWEICVYSKDKSDIVPMVIAKFDNRYEAYQYYIDNFLD